MAEYVVKFAIGQLIHHRLFGYRGVVVDVDATFQHSEEWYQQVARSRPPKDEPWYHVLVDGSDDTTYVAEQNLEPTDDDRPIRHPLVGVFFDEYRDGRYHNTTSVT